MCVLKHHEGNIYTVNPPKKYARVITLKIEANSLENLQGRLIKIARLAKGLTQEELALKLDVPRGAVVEWEQSGVGNEVYQLEEMLGVDHGAFRVK